MMRFYLYDWLDNELIVDGVVAAKIVREKVDGRMVWVGYMGGQRIQEVGRHTSDSVVMALEMMVLSQGYCPPLF